VDFVSCALPGPYKPICIHDVAVREQGESISGRVTSVIAWSHPGCHVRSGDRRTPTSNRDNDDGTGHCKYEYHTGGDDQPSAGPTGRAGLKLNRRFWNIHRRCAFWMRDLVEQSRRPKSLRVSDGGDGGCRKRSPFSRGSGTGGSRACGNRGETSGTVGAVKAQQEDAVPGPEVQVSMEMSSSDHLRGSTKNDRAARVHVSSFQAAARSLTSPVAAPLPHAMTSCFMAAPSPCSVYSQGCPGSKGGRFPEPRKSRESQDSGMPHPVTAVPPGRPAPPPAGWLPGERRAPLVPPTEPLRPPPLGRGLVVGPGSRTRGMARGDPVQALLDQRGSSVPRAGTARAGVGAEICGSARRAATRPR
jgi:hypothetical protein